MSQQNVDAVRRADEHFARTREPLWDKVDGDVEVFDHDIPDAHNPYRAADGMAEWLSDFAESWNHYEMDLERLVDAGDRVVSLRQRPAAGPRGAGTDGVGERTHACSTT